MAISSKDVLNNYQNLEISYMQCSLLSNHHKKQAQPRTDCEHTPSDCDRILF